ncbi:Zn-dependent peptidase ImmA (M78 family)/transcriptional regulator with XRE-family HTH domain [Pseudomonas frederiksbergensis]|uniref:ImmA/IrrE family metallo-endopeptidase n=1 Tax=Pseudomonas frederiksbergensis TaxID=104087 RepID=UPI003D24BAE2
MSQSAFINPALLSWSRLRAGLSEIQVAKGLPVKPQRIRDWEAGRSLPTFNQAQKWASIAHVPFGFLFLKEPPAERLPLPDLRTVGGVSPSRPSLGLIDTIKDVLRKQDWYLEYLQDHDVSPLPFVGRFSTRSSVLDVVSDLREVLRIGGDDKQQNHDNYLRDLISAAEAVGILVMRSGVVLGNTHRKLDVSEFRGFAISDRLAPVVFINSADAPSARLFTLVHELAHIWIGSTGISDGGTHSDRDEEAFCNAVAGEFLVPQDAFRSAWDMDGMWTSNLVPLAARFRVSKWVVARRACDLGFISSGQYGAYYQQELQAYRDKEGSGGSYYPTASTRNSVRFSKAVIAEAQSGRMLLREAGKLLGIQPAKLKTYASRLLA